MKNLINKLIPLVGTLKNKKPVVLVIIAAAIGLGYFAVHKGWISEDALNVEMIIHGVSEAFENSSKLVTDSVTSPADSLSVIVVDSISNN